MQSDPRRSPEPAHRANAVLIHLPRLYEVALIDASLRGALIGTRKLVEIELGEQVRLRVLTERGNQAFEVEARVAHRAEIGIGLEFDTVDQHARRSLQRLIGTDRSAGDPAARTLGDLIEAHCYALLASEALAPRPAQGADHAFSTVRAYAAD